MKRLALLLLAFGVYTLNLQAQTLVSTKPYHRIVVLEEFTGIHCGYCPDGHRLATQLYNKYNQEPVLINVHAGGYAEPGPDEPDFRCVYGAPLDSQALVSGYPAGTINRHKFFNNDTTSMGRTAWDIIAPKLMELSSPVNVGLRSSFDSVSRKLTVDVEAYYTANAPVSTNALNVALLENNVIGMQYDYGTGEHNAEYHHMHMLRWLLTGQWGDVITTTTKGTLVKRTYTYVVPAEFNVANCDVAAFIAEGPQEIYTGAKVAAMGGTTLQVSTLSLTSGVAQSGAAGIDGSFSLMANNVLGADEQFNVRVETTMPSDWKINTQVSGVAYTGSSFTIKKADSAAIRVVFSPGSTSAVGRADIYLNSVTYPNSPIIHRAVYFMSGVENLLMSHPDGMTYDSVYTRAMTAAGCPKMGMMDRNIFELFAAENALTGLKSVYYNVSWAFPGITDLSMKGLKKLLDGGTNLLVAGQDYGWDLASTDTSSHATTDTRDFYKNYMHATFSADGGTANSRFTAYASDQIFKSVPTSTITAPYGASYFYPDQFVPIAPAKTIFTYNNFTSKVGGLRFEGGYKLVYLGVGLEQLSIAAGDMIVKQAHRWFSGELSAVEFDDLVAGGASVSPNPAATSVSVVLPESIEQGSVRIVDEMGRVVLEKSIIDATARLQVDIHELASGSYRLCVFNALKSEVSSTQLSIVR